MSTNKIDLIRAEIERLMKRYESISKTRRNIPR